ncbi:hypothetical protein [Alicyclobacillus fodiniaquatilis]|uniref:Uncharacterized protein n=1 Tax=Alicyclobacillus fodiniaquatilis TaxID=1661150 RepID=A0ABW4JCS4_9BACL
MRYVIALIFLIGYYVEVHISTLNVGLEENAYERFTYACENASHDAALDVTPESIATGQPVFDETAATNTFDQDLAANMDLDPQTLKPLPNTMFQAPVTVLTEQFIDYSNTTFPYEYKDAAYGIDVTLEGPAIAYVVQAQIPSIQPGVTSFTKTWAVVQSYPGDSND